MNDALKQTIDAKQFIQAPGVYDALSAKIVEAKGFQAAYMTGYGTSAALFGYPDIGLLTMTEMVESARRIAEAISIPLISDADTGYGNPINVHRTVREFEKAGVSCIHIEDQEWPKRCGYMSGKKLIDTETMIGKIKSALDARSSSGFLIIARTDALSVHGFDHAVERANLYADAGADMVFIDAVTSREQAEKIPVVVSSKPNVINLGPFTPNLAAKELEEMGYAVAIYPGICLAPMVASVNEALERLKTRGVQPNFSEWAQSFADLNEFLGVPQFRQLEEKYRSQ